jgi:transposase
MLTVNQWEQIRRAYHIEGQSIREIARTTGLARRTVQKMVVTTEPPQYRRQQTRQAHKLGPYKERIQELLEQNKTLPRKQRWTAPTIYRHIQDERLCKGAESTVRHYVGQVRKLQKQPAVFLPLAFDPGTDAQMDWGEAKAILAGQQVTVQLFLLKLSYSRRTFMMAFPGQKQEALFAGHVAAFDFFGGIPTVSATTISRRLSKKSCKDGIGSNKKLSTTFAATISSRATSAPLGPAMKKGK